MQNNRGVAYFPKRKLFCIFYAYCWRDCIQESGQNLNLKHFLENNNVPFWADAFHQELFALASTNKPGKQYHVNSFINAAGHKVLRLPPYYCHYNPIEMVRNDCKRYYKTHVGSQFDRAHVKQVWPNVLH